MYRFIITGETPSKKNSRIVLKGGRNIPSGRYRKWHTAAMIEINSQLLLLKKEKEAMPIEREIRIKMTFYHGATATTAQALYLTCSRTAR